MEKRRAIPSSSSTTTGIPVRSGIPRPSSQGEPASNIPRPSSRLSSTSAIPSASSTSAPTPVSRGPPGPYSSRPASRAGQPPTSVSDSLPPPVAATPAASRLRYSVGGSSAAANPSVTQSAAPERRTYTGISGRISAIAPPSGTTASSNSALGLVGATPLRNSTSSSSKRSISAAGLGDESISNGFLAKRTNRRLSADGTSPLLLTTDLHPSTTPRPESPSYELSILRANYDRQLLAEDRKYKKLEQDYQDKCKELDRFNRQRVELLNEWDIEQESRKEKEVEWSQTKLGLEEEVLQLRAKNAELSSKLDEVQTFSQAEAAQARSQTTSLESQLAHAKAETEASRALIKQLEDNLGIARAEIEDLQSAVEDERRTRLQEREEERVGGEEGKRITDELDRQTVYIRKIESENAQLVSENAHLKKHASNAVELLKEEKRSFETKATAFEGMNTKLATAESMIRDLELQQTHWQTAFQAGIEEDIQAGALAAAASDVSQEIPTTEAPACLDSINLSKYIASLRGILAGLTLRIQSLTLSFDQLRDQNVQLEQESSQANAQWQQASQQLETLQSSLARSQETEANLQEEILRLKTEAETLNKVQENSETDAAATSNDKAQRISELESELEQLTSESTKLAKELDAARAQTHENQSNMETVENEKTLLANELQVARDALSNQTPIQPQAEISPAELELLQSQLGSASDRIKTLQLEMDRLVTDNLHLTHQLETVVQTNPIEPSEIERLKMENSQLSNQVETARAASLMQQEMLVSEDQVQELQNQLDSALNQIQSLESQLQQTINTHELELQQTIKTHELELQQDNKTHKLELEQKNISFVQLEKEAQDLAKENELLYYRVGRGEFDTTREKCLVLLNNPISQDLNLRKKNLESLKKENESLLKRVEELSLVAIDPQSNEKGNGNSALVPKEVVENLQLDIQGLQQSIKEKEKALLRLKQVFSAKANEFREAVQSLFGYKIKFLENGKVKVTSTNARSSKSTSLIFKSEKRDIGQMQLQGEAVEFPGLANLESLRQYWLDPDGVRNSVPCFLAALNLELYESCTMAIRRNTVHDQDDEIDE